MKSLYVRLVLIGSLLLLPLQAKADLFISANFSNQILRYNETTGALLGVISDSRLSGPSGIAIGPDGMLWVANGNKTALGGVGSPEIPNAILRYDLQGNYLSTFAQGGNLNAPSDLKFGPDGQLYVGNLGERNLGFNGDSVLKYNPNNGSTSTKIGVGNISGASYITFGTNNDMYVSSYGQTFAGNITKYNLATGAFDSVYIANANGLQAPTALVFKGSTAYVADTFAGVIKRYDTVSGAFIDNFLTLPTLVQDGPFPSDLLFQGNNLLIAELGNHQISKYDSSGTQLAPFAPQFSNGLLTPGYFLVAAVPEPGTWVALLGSGLIGFLSLRRKRSN